MIAKTNSDNDIQRMAAAVEFLPWLESEAKARQVAAGGNTLSQEYKEALPEKIPEAAKGDSRDKAAEMLNVSEHSVNRS